MASRVMECPACEGRRIVPNAKTGEPCACPVCAATGQVEPDYHRLPFWYIIAITGGAGAGQLGANGNLTGALQIAARADFELVWMAATSTGTFSDRLTDSSGRVWENLRVNNANRWGTAQLPFALPVPVVIPASSSLNWDVTDTSGANNTVQLALIGYELYVSKPVA